MAEKPGTARNEQFSEMMEELGMAGFVAADTGMNPERGVQVDLPQAAWAYDRTAP